MLRYKNGNIFLKTQTYRDTSVSKCGIPYILNLLSLPTLFHHINFNISFANNTINALLNFINSENVFKVFYGYLIIRLRQYKLNNNSKYDESYENFINFKNMYEQICTNSRFWIYGFYKKEKSLSFPKGSFGRELRDYVFETIFAEHLVTESGCINIFDTKIREYRYTEYNIFAIIFNYICDLESCMKKLKSCSHCGCAFVNLDNNTSFCSVACKNYSGRLAKRRFDEKAKETPQELLYKSAYAFTNRRYINLKKYEVDESYIKEYNELCKIFRKNAVQKKRKVYSELLTYKEYEEWVFEEENKIDQLYTQLLTNNEGGK